MFERRFNPFRLRTSAEAVLLLALVSLQSGCYYVYSSEYFHSAQNPAAYKGCPIEFKIGDINYLGHLTSTDTIVFTLVPVVPAFIANDNPYHLRLWTKGDKHPMDAPQITSVSLETHEGKVLLIADGPSDFSRAEVRPDHHEGGIPVFSQNAQFAGWRHRLNTRDGWAYSRAVQVPWLCDKLLLRVGYRRKLPDETFGPLETKEVPLKYYKHSDLVWLTDTMFLSVTGSF